MESGLEGRNNHRIFSRNLITHNIVSMESGLEGRNNAGGRMVAGPLFQSVSMESGLEGRNNSLRSIAIMRDYKSQWSPA